MDTLMHYQRNKMRYEMLFLFCYFFINATVLATSVLMEAKRTGGTLPFSLWEPFTWEYTSALSSLLLFPLIITLINRVPLNGQQIKRTFAIYFSAAIVFSFCHVLLMVLMRKFIYAVNSRHYDFGNISFEMLYELRKDIWSFVFFVIFIHAYRFILSRLQGEANPIQEGETQIESQQLTTNIDRLLIKKLGKEFIIKIEHVEWMEASGNYVNLHIDERVYPIRSTLTALIAKLENKGFCRIHRSHAVRLDAIESITPLSSGDSEVKMQSGKRLNLSRRYKDGLKLMLS
nr:LytTR family DNA-binding domain-containing protein [Thalassotalea hakodatensis]